MDARAVLPEVLHFATSIAVTLAVFASAAWAYPQGHATIWNVGFVTLAAVAVMCVHDARTHLRARAGNDG